MRLVDGLRHSKIEKILINLDDLGIKPLDNHFRALIIDYFVLGMLAVILHVTNKIFESESDSNFPWIFSPAINLK